MTRLALGFRQGGLPIVFVALVTLAGCGSSGGSATGSGGSGGGGSGGGGTGGGGSGGTIGNGGSGGSSGACTAGSAMGTLAIQVVGTQTGAADILVDGTMALTAAASGPLTVGPHTVAAYLVAEPGTIARAAYTPTIDVADPCVRAGQTTTVTVTYTMIPTSRLVWMGASNTPSPATLLGFSPDTIATSGTVSSDVAVNTFGSDGFTFDPQGGVWVLGATTADPPLAHFPASALSTDGDKTPDITIDSPSFGNGVPGAKVVAFEPATGNLWVAVVAANKIVRFTPGQLAASGTPTADVEQTGITAPAGIAFDASGNMWVAENGGDAIARIDAAHLTSSGSGADLTITAWTPSPIVSTLASPLGIAFDHDGDLWVNYNGVMASLSPTDLSGTGAKSVTPAVQITLGVQSLPYGIAFDEQGGLWFADRAGRFACLTAGQLAASGSITPAVVIASPDLGSAGWFALYPAPAFSPLAHALP